MSPERLDTKPFFRFSFVACAPCFPAPGASQPPLRLELDSVERHLPAQILFYAMTESDLQRIESELGLNLPPRYRALALRLPSVDDDEAEDIASWYPFMDPDRIIERNRTLRENGWIDGSPWLSNLFCIGTFESGDYFVDLTSLDRGVFYANTSGEPEWSPYRPDDYSDCWVHSFEVLENR